MIRERCDDEAYLKLQTTRSWGLSVWYENACM